MPLHTTVADPVELDLIRNWREPLTARRIFRDAGGSVLVHIIALAVFMILPAVETPPVLPPPRTDVKKAVHLVAPRIFEPTQKAPNKGKVTKELDIRSMEQTPTPQSPRVRRPTPAPGAAASDTPAPTPIPAATPAPVIEPPKIIAAAPPPPPPPVTVTPQPSPVPPPPPAAPPKPKLAFESVGAQLPTTPAPNSTIPIPKVSVQDAIRRAAPGNNGTIVGDVGDSSTTIPNLSQSPSSGRIGSNLQLLSDAQGVDFKPYLIQVLTAVRRNWLAIIPESARMGMRGRVLIQFSIDRKGAVPKLVIAEGAGTEALDRAAVAAISASYPFPSLPADYKGDQIRLQLAFAYNMATR